ncbi:hypothetical protein E2C01_021500 [Portunus trituberculatus]|uniref:Uncharacterized protein n=1 Tax=Portunus trituberculatus TaxID=210409 RepID=A0A5B7E4F4_PORTR|nr:hypothetical protein [Portunus trituberculatus]
MFTSLACPEPVCRRGTVEPCVLWGSRGLQAESCPRSECRFGFLTLGNGFLATSGAIIHGPAEVYIKTGSTLVLTCSAAIHANAITKLRLSFREFKAAPVLVLLCLATAPASLLPSSSLSGIRQPHLT